MSGPFDSEMMDASAEAYEADAGADYFDDQAMFEEGDSGDAFGEEGYDVEDMAGIADGFDETTLDLGEEATDDLALWNAFEEEVADGLDAVDDDEFLGRLLGGLGRAASMVGRASTQARQVAGRVGQVAGAVSPAAQAVARLAQTLGAPGVAGALQQVGGIAREMGQAAGQARGLAGSVGRLANQGQGIFSQLGQLLGSSSGAQGAFDAMVDLYVDEGVDEALPAAAALAARGAARGLGFRNIAQLSQAGRRALVRGVAAATRELVRGGGPQGIRALPRLVNSAVRVTRRAAGSPQRAVQNVRRGLPQAARRLTQNPQALRNLTQQRTTGPRPLTRPTNLGHGVSDARLAGPRTYRISGPVTITITPNR
ncbi:hypothetical protein E0E52_18105 [Azotobacter chroococcum]|uniref:hypothetical protein n=1 Tax=Azotobacter chroococcum TaxID=353 RepID=UPI00103F175A|nr:hypothetical protein [Azotobacter chroococcum]TBW02153.1 hypothetical protein E0E52_18105 [Azotobacter chroococcum]